MIQIHKMLFGVQNRVRTLRFDNENLDIGYDRIFQFDKIRNLPKKHKVSYSPYQTFNHFSDKRILSR